MHVEAMIEAKNAVGHLIYEATRKLVKEVETERALYWALLVPSRRLYDAALAAARSRASASAVFSSVAEEARMVLLDSGKLILTREPLPSILNKLAVLSEYETSTNGTSSVSRNRSETTVRSDMEGAPPDGGQGEAQQGRKAKGKEVRDEEGRLLAPNTDASRAARARNVQTFEGEVETEGRQFLLADDTLTMGGTLVALYEHLMAQGADVRGLTTLAGGQYGRALRTTPAEIARFLERLGLTDEQFRDASGRPASAVAGTQLRSLGRYRGKPGQWLAERFPPPADAGRAAGAGTGERGSGGEAFWGEDSVVLTEDLGAVQADEGPAPPVPQDPEETNTQPTDPQATLSPARFPVERMPLADLHADPDTFQYKLEVDEEGVQRELEGEWNELAAGVLLVWERASDGMRFVANGHHRRAHAIRMGVEALNVQVLREADGFSAVDARRLAAEANIMDGKGTIYDQAEYFRNEGQYDEATAQAKGVKGRGYNIARFAADDVYMEFMRRTLSEERTLALLRGAGDDKVAQRVALKWAFDHPTRANEQVFFFAQQARTARASGEAPQRLASADETDDMFSTAEDDDVRAWAEDAEAKAARDAAEARDIREELAALTGPTKTAARVKLAAKLGIHVEDREAVQAHIEKLRARLRELMGGAFSFAPRIVQEAAPARTDIFGEEVEPARELIREGDSLALPDGRTVTARVGMKVPAGARVLGRQGGLFEEEGRAERLAQSQAAAMRRPVTAPAPPQRDMFAGVLDDEQLALFSLANARPLAARQRAIIDMVEEAREMLRQRPAHYSERIEYDGRAATLEFDHGQFGLSITMHIEVRPRVLETWGLVGWNARAGLLEALKAAHPDVFERASAAIQAGLASKMRATEALRAGDAELKALARRVADEIWDEVDRSGTPVFLRFGRPPSGRSRHHNTGALEAGVSVYRGYRISERVWVIDYNGIDGLSALYIREGRDLFEVAGAELPGVRGSDGEPLLKSARVVSQVPADAEVWLLTMPRSRTEESDPDALFSLAPERNADVRRQMEAVPEVRDGEGRLLAPNGKPSRLNERQWKQVRTEAFKAWFGDWERDPENASRVVDENGEPLVVYHGTRAGEFGGFEQSFRGVFRAYFSDNPGVAGLYASEFNSGAGPGGGGSIVPAFLRIIRPVNENLDDVLRVAFEGEAEALRARAMEQWDWYPAALTMIDAVPRGDVAALIEVVLDLADALGTSGHVAEDSVAMSESPVRHALSLARGRWDRVLAAFDGVVYRDAEVGGITFAVASPSQIKSATGNVGTFDGSAPDVRMSFRRPTAKQVEAAVRALGADMDRHVARTGSVYYTIERLAPEPGGWLERVGPSVTLRVADHAARITDRSTVPTISVAPGDLTWAEAKKALKRALESEEAAEAVEAETRARIEARAREDAEWRLKYGRFSLAALEAREPVLREIAELAGDEPRFAIEAYHGTGARPFKQFDTAFLGSGEGAQVFGWGLYFTESREVAEWYADKLRPKVSDTVYRRNLSRASWRLREAMNRLGADKLEQEAAALGPEQLVHWERLRERWDIQRGVDIEDVVAGMRREADLAAAEAQKKRPTARPPALLGRGTPFVYGLSGGERRTRDTQPFQTIGVWWAFDPQHDSSDLLSLEGPGKIRARADSALSRGESVNKGGAGLELLAEVLRRDDVLADLSAMMREVYPRPASVYRVTLHPGKTEHRWLDWPDPVPEDIAAAVAELAAADGLPELSALSIEQSWLSGRHLYSALVEGARIAAEEGASPSMMRQAAARYASETLRRAGLDGIRYEADGGRGGKFNYVIFSGEDVRIEERADFSLAQRMDRSRAGAVAVAWGLAKGDEGLRGPQAVEQVMTRLGIEDRAEAETILARGRELADEVGRRKLGFEMDEVLVRNLRSLEVRNHYLRTIRETWASGEVEGRLYEQARQVLREERQAERDAAVARRRGLTPAELGPDFLERVLAAEDKVHYVFSIPLGRPNSKEALDRAIESTPGAIALTDAIVSN